MREKTRPLETVSLPPAAATPPKEHHHIPQLHRLCQTVLRCPFGAPIGRLVRDIGGSKVGVVLGSRRGAADGAPASLFARVLI